MKTFGQMLAEANKGTWKEVNLPGYTISAIPNRTGLIGLQSKDIVHVLSNKTTLKQMGVYAPHTKDGPYGVTHHVRVENNETGETTEHALYQSGYDKNTKTPILSLRDVGKAKQSQEAHRDLLIKHLSQDQQDEEVEQLDELSKKTYSDAARRFKGRASDAKHSAEQSLVRAAQHRQGGNEERAAAYENDAAAGHRDAKKYALLAAKAAKRALSAPAGRNSLYDSVDKAYKPETSSLMDSYVQAIDSDVDFKTVKEEAEQIDEGKYGPPKVIKPKLTQRAAQKGFDEDDSKRINEIVQHIRQHNVNQFLSELPKNTPESDKRRHALAANPIGYPKVRIKGDRVSVLVGFHGDIREAGIRAAALTHHLLRSGHDTQPFVSKTSGEGGFSYGVIPNMSKVPTETPTQGKKGKKMVKQDLFTIEELERLAEHGIDVEDLDQLDSTDEYTMQEGTYHKVKYPSSKGVKPLERSVFIPDEKDDPELHRREYADLAAKEKYLAAKAGDPNNITQADTLAARLESGIETNKDPKKVKDMLALLKKLK